MKQDWEIRERIIKINQALKKVTSQRDLDKAGIRGLMLLSERYTLWWVLGEVRKHQGRVRA